MAFFYYDQDIYCDLKKSDRLPQPMKIKCDHECRDGFFSVMGLNNKNQPELTCSQCKAGSIAVSGGFRYDARMDSSSYFPDKSNADLKGFK